MHISYCYWLNYSKKPYQCLFIFPPKHRNVGVGQELAAQVEAVPDQDGLVGQLLLDVDNLISLVCKMPVTLVTQPNPCFGFCELTGHLQLEGVLDAVVVVADHALVVAAVGHLQVGQAQLPDVALVQLLGVLVPCNVEVVVTAGPALQQHAAARTLAVLLQHPARALEVRLVVVVLQRGRLLFLRVVVQRVHVVRVHI